jgi:hypothetical protein
MFRAIDIGTPLPVLLFQNDLHVIPPSLLDIVPSFRYVMRDEVAQSNTTECKLLTLGGFGADPSL